MFGGCLVNSGVVSSGILSKVGFSRIVLDERWRVVSYEQYNNRLWGFDLNNVDVKRARYFLKLSETLNFSDAAKALGISQPGLTKAINQLEQDIGATLIRREGRNTHLTQIGTSLLEHFTKLVRVADLVEREARLIVSGDMPLIRLGLMCTIGPGPVAEFLAEFQKMRPDVEVVLRSLVRSNITDVLLAGDVDLAFVGAEIDGSQRFKNIPLYREKMVVASSLEHEFSTRGAISLEEVTKEPYIDRLQCELRDTFLTEVEKRSFSPAFAIRTENETWAQTMVASGVGVTIIPEFSIENDGIARTQLSDVNLDRTVSLAVSYGREDTNIVRAFIRAIGCYDWGKSDL